MSLISAEVHGKTVSDPNHKGWTGKYPKLKQASWKPISTDCKQCSKIVTQYNQTVQQLLVSRYWVKFWREAVKYREKGKADPLWPGKGDISEFEGKAVKANIDLMEQQALQQNTHRQLVNSLEQQAQYLSGVISECERNACVKEKPTKQKKIKIGGETSKIPFQPDVKAILAQYGINWKGPYRTNCLPCQSITQQLNALPGWVARKHFQLQNAEALFKYVESIDKTNSIKLSFLQYKHPDKTNFDSLIRDIQTFKRDLEAFKTLFEKLLVQLKECTAKYCVNLKDENISLIGEPISTCTEPPAHEAITVGANNEVGSKANFKEKAKKKLTGAAVSTLAKFVGLGVGGNKQSTGPLIYKDPIKKKHKTRVRNKESKRDFYTGGGFTPEGLLISSDIKKAPGNGTFHSVYLENERGWRLMPIGIYMYEIWRDWKLNVSWTRDTYVNDELVKHEEGGWSESWREFLDSGEETIYGENTEQPLWQQLGFTTAVSGARSLGTLFAVTPDMLASEQWNLVVHISDPKKDPVTTFPMIFGLKLDNKGRIEASPSQNTVANQSIDCDALDDEFHELLVMDADENLTGYAEKENSSFDSLIRRSLVIVRHKDEFDLESKQTTLKDLIATKDQLIAKGVDQKAEAFVRLNDTITTLLRQTQNTANYVESLEEEYVFEFLNESSDYKGGLEQFKKDYDEYRSSKDEHVANTGESDLDTVSIKDDVGHLRGSAQMTNLEAQAVLDGLRQLYDLAPNKISDATSTEESVFTNGPEIMRQKTESQSHEEEIDANYATELDARFKQIYDRKQRDKNFIEQFDFKRKYHVLKDLDRLRQELIVAGTSPTSVELAVVIDTIAALERQLENAGNEARTADIVTHRFAVFQIYDHATYLGENPIDIKNAFWDSYYHYERERNAEDDSLELISVVDDLGPLRGSNEMSTKDARAVLEKYQNFKNSATRFSDTLDILNLRETLLLNDTTSVMWEQTINGSGDNSSPSIRVRCTDAAVANKEPLALLTGVFSEGADRGILVKEDGYIESSESGEELLESGCVLKTESSMRGLRLSDFFGGNAFAPLNSTPGKKFVLQEGAVSSKIAASLFNTEDKSFEDRDGDGIEDSIDTKPDEYSNQFFQDGGGNMVGTIINRNGNSVRIKDIGDDGVRVEVGTETENDSVVELLGIEIELEAGSSIDAAFA